jgi:LysM repeat protein
MIKRTLYTLLFLGLMIIVSTPCSAQDNVNNVRSKIVENFNGKPYYIHFVKDGQTLFSISKLYSINSDILIANNPDLKEGLKADMILKIPVTDTVVSVQKQQTVYASKKTDTIIASPTVKTFGKIVYEIKRGETLYGIAKRYEVSLDDILSVNPGVTSFKAGTKIKIPVIQQVANQSAATSKPVKSTVVNAKPSDVKAPETKLAANTSSFNDLPEKNSSGQFKVALLVPFYLDEVDSIKMNQTEPKSFAFLQFYESSLLAIDSLRKQGMDVKLFVYDADGDEGIDKTRAIFQKKELADMDLIIGPFYAKCFEIASKYAGLHRIPIVNPLSKRNEIIAAKPWVFKVQPGTTDQMSELAAFISKHSPSANVVIVRSDKIKMAEEATAFKTAMLPLLKKDNKSAIIKESFFGAEGVPGLKFKLSADKPNILLVLSTDEVFVSGLFRNLNGISNDYDLTVMGMGAWEQYKLDINTMMHLKLHLYGNKYVDFSDQPVQKFSTAFLHAYNTLPQIKAYGFDGFDITYFFLSSLMKYGRQFGLQVGEYEYQGLQDSFHFHKIEGGGYENSAVNFYKIENNYLKRVQ